MKPMRFIFFLSFLFVAIKFVYAEPDDDSFFDKTVIDLLRDKISDDRITVEPNYVSKSKIRQITNTIVYKICKQENSLH